MFLMALLAFIIGPMILITRIRAVNAGKLPMRYFEIFQGGKPPEAVTKTTRNWSNLFEAPMLFYIVCLLALAIQLESALLTSLAWVYVILRVGHSVVHLTYNNVYHRFVFFLLSMIVLLAMWIVAFIQVI